MSTAAAAFPPEITAADIMSVVSERFGVPIAELVDGIRTRGVMQARQSAMYPCRQLTELTPTQIGALFGGRDHTVVLQAERKIRTQMSERFDTRNQILEMTTRLKLRGP